MRISEARSLTARKITEFTKRITGASSGIGEASAYQFAKDKTNLILTATNLEKLNIVKEKCISLGAQCKILQYDLSDLENVNYDVLVFFSPAGISAFGTIDTAFLNAGISQRSKTLDTSFKVDEKIMTINFFAPVKITKQLLPKMIENGGGTIAVTSSISGKFGFPLRSAYSSSKFAVYGFFETVHAEYYDDNIRVVMVCPGRIKTNISYNALEADGSKHAKMDEGQDTGMSAEKAAAKIVKAINRRKPEVLVGGKELIMVYIKRFLPGLARKLVRKVSAT